MCFTGFFHLLFQRSLAVLSLLLLVPFLSPILRGKNDLFNNDVSASGVIDSDLLFIDLVGLAVGRQGNSICTGDFSV